MTFTKPFWIEGPWPGRLAISPRPRGGDWLTDEVQSWHKDGVDVVVSLLEQHEAADLELADERETCETNGLGFYSLPIVDRSVPQEDGAVASLLRQIENELIKGRNILIHCRQGVGRAGLIATALLIEAGMNPTRAMERVSSARGVPVPETQVQRLWIDAFAAAFARKA